MKIEGDYIIFTNDEARQLPCRVRGDQYLMHGEASDAWSHCGVHEGSRYTTTGYEVRRPLSLCTDELKQQFAPEYQHFI